MKVRIEGVMNPCTFLGCSFEERAGFQKITVNITPDFEGVTDAQREEWVKETENRCPVIDNIRADTDIEVKVAKE